MSVSGLAVVTSVLGLTAVIAGCGGDSADQGADPATTAKDKDNPSADTAGHETVVMREFEFRPSALTVSGRKLSITAKNAGQQEHEFVLLRTKKPPDAIPSKAGKASESGSVGEISEQEPSRSATHTFKLKPGKYVFVCNVDGHYQAGMRGSLTVK